mgnify:CR=1 FL=1
MQFLQFLFRQRQLFIAVHTNITLNDVARDFLRFFQRVHLVSTALVNVQLRDLVLLFHLQHVFHRRFPRISDAFLFRLANQAHVETGTAAHRRDIDNLNAVTVQVVAHKSGEQVLQPAKSKWDIMWAYAASSTMMASGPVISFTQDVITINNLGGAETAIVMTDTKSYADFKRADVASAEFQTEANTIGTNWRTPAMPGVENPGVKADRFFVIKDCAENYYKLRFLKFGSGDDGERGRPQLEYELLK